MNDEMKREAERLRDLLEIAYIRGARHGIAWIYGADPDDVYMEAFLESSHYHPRSKGNDLCKESKDS